jgi:hypothetical protein
MMNWKGFRRKRLCPNFKYYPRLWPGGTEEKYEKQPG